MDLASSSAVFVVGTSPKFLIAFQALCSAEMKLCAAVGAVHQSRKQACSSCGSRSAAVFAELLGFGASLDGGALTAPDESARFAEQAVRGALADAGLEPHAVDWVSAHGTGTPLNDRSEAVLLERVFAQAEARPAVTALKSWIGHGSAACGGMELALMLAAWRSGRLPPIRNLRAPCSGLLDFAVATRPFPGPVGVLENFGFGGQNAALVVRCGDD